MLFFTCARVNEIRDFTYEDVLNLLKDQIILINQTKTRSIRKIILGKKAMTYFKSLEKDIDMVFLSNNTLSGGQNKINWIKFINKRLKAFTLVYNKNSNITSHSFRIGFVTKLIQKLPIHVVKDLVNHESIQTTLKYSRNKLSDSEKADAFDLLVD